MNAKRGYRNIRWYDRHISRFISRKGSNNTWRIWIQSKTKIKKCSELKNVVDIVISIIEIFKQEEIQNQSNWWLIDVNQNILIIGTNQSITSKITYKQLTHSNLFLIMTFRHKKDNINNKIYVIRGY